MRVIGFDLDMTLVDSRAATAHCFARLGEQLGVAFDLDGAVARLGTPLEAELGRVLAVEQVPAAVHAYDSIYLQSGYALSTALPGAAAALALVSALGWQSLLVTAKPASTAAAVLEAVGLSVDSVVGGLWGSGKGSALAAAGAQAYLGDHPLDVLGARAAGALAVGVATGHADVEVLAGSGCDVVLADLTEFAGWFTEFGRVSA